MTLLSAERTIRAGLPVTRLLGAYLPLGVTRWLMQQSARHGHLPDDVTREAVSAGGVRCEWLIPHGSSTEQTLLYLHGGGFVLGFTSLQLEMVAYLARQMGVRALLVDYRLAPEHPFPEPLDDCVTAYRWLLEQGVAAENIMVVGDSAGGNLALTSLMKLRDDGDPLPAAAACLSPVADLTGEDSPFAEEYDLVLHPKAASLYSRSYVADHDAHDPLISPVFGDWHGLPPLLIHAGEGEILREDAVRIEELAREAGVDVRLEIYPRMWHVWQMYLTLPQAVRALDAVAQFLESHLRVSSQRPGLS